MKPSNVVAASLVALACALAPARAHATEPSGPVTLAVHSSCPALAANVTNAANVANVANVAEIAAPLPLLWPASVAVDTSPALACGPCSQPVCVGKPLNSFCFGTLRLCQEVTVCASTAALVPLCECLSPP
jgi:hypothetical protein